MTTREVVATVRVFVEIDEDNSYLDEDTQIERALAEIAFDVIEIEQVV
jgi:hypothetical protein